MTTNESQIKAGDTVEHIDPARRRGTWTVVKVEGNRLTVTNPHTHSGRVYIAADQHQVVGS